MYLGELLHIIETHPCPQACIACTPPTTLTPIGLQANPLYGLGSCGWGSMELDFEYRYVFILSIVLYSDVATTFPRGLVGFREDLSPVYALLPVTTPGYFRSGRKKTPLYIYIYYNYTSSQKANFHPVQEKMVETYLEQLVSTDQRLSYSRRQLSILSEY